jgi:hypothetical protein
VTLFIYHRANQAVHVVNQPQHFIANSFGMFNGETLLHDWKLEQGCCGCAGSYYTTLTDTRLLNRYEECVCCSCCCDPAHNDSAIFLHDIAQMVEATQARGCLNILCAKCCVFCPCCCRGPKILQVRGSFSSYILHLTKHDVAIAKPAIAEAIAHQKPGKRH